MSKVGIRVVLRTRPTARFAQDKVIIDPEKGSISLNLSEGNKKDTVSNKKEIHSFQFHNILHNSSQESVYTLINPMINSVLEGYNATILAYGQTGAGKTYTMLGRTGDFYQRGIIPRCVHQIFDEIEMRSDMEFHVSCSYMEIYNEKIFDLLSDRPDDRMDYQITEEPGVQGGIVVRGLIKIPVTTEEETLELLFRGGDRRTISEHNLNKNSNRSHCIFTLHIEQQSRLGDNSKIITSKLHLVDLAGSERMINTVGSETLGISTNQLVKESLYINSSLSYLEQCVVALSSANRAHIPYRQSKLTYILRDSLGGNCKTLLIACVYCENEHLSESISTLRFASRMMRVKNINLANVVYDSEQLIRKYENQIKELKAELMLSAAFSGKSTDAYSDLTESQKTELGKKVRQFVECNENEEEGLLDFSSLHQVKEIFKQFKLISKQLMQETASKIKSEIPANTAQPVTGANSQNNIPSDQTNANTQPGVGELNTTNGFSIGKVADDAKPLYPMSRQNMTRGGVGDPQSNMRTIPQTNEPSKPGSPLRESKTGFNISQMPEMGGSSIDNENAINFDLFKSGEGRIFYKNVLAEKEQLNTLNYDIKILINDINSLKENIDLIRQKIEAKKKLNTEIIDGQRVVDEEEYNMVTTLTLYKKNYQNNVDELQAKRIERTAKDEDLLKARRVLLEEYEKWSIGTKSKGLMNDGTREEMDYGEQFERMQMENDLASDPNSVAYYNAQRKNLKNSLRSDHRRRF